MILSTYWNPFWEQENSGKAFYSKVWETSNQFPNLMIGKIQRNSSKGSSGHVGGSFENPTEKQSTKVRRKKL